MEFINEAPNAPRKKSRKEMTEEELEARAERKLKRVKKARRRVEKSKIEVAEAKEAYEIAQEEIIANMQRLQDALKQE